MKRQLSCWALLACIATGALLLAGCSTVSSRIEGNRAAFDQLSPKDQALVSQGRIAPGMSQQAVYIAWGQPQQKAIGMVREIATESWVYTLSTAAYGPIGYGGLGYGYGYGYGFAGRVGFYGRRGGRRYYGAFVNPYWDPFYYPFAATVTYPVKTVSFQNGRVIAFQYLVPSGY
jgi:outer membrane murein-binding lipoprotein Lpp